MARQPAFHLEPDEILDAAVAILREEGLEAVSMRTVSARLGVSPIPLYSRVGNKDALLDAIAERLLADLAPELTSGEQWSEYATRWAEELHRRLREVPDASLILSARRWAYVEASKPLVSAMRAGGMEPDAAVRACRLLMWATVGFAALQAGGTSEESPSGRAPRIPGGDPAGLTVQEADELFALHIRYLIDGLVRDETPGTTPRRRSVTRSR
jgi:AcrR family transcriptional regulator